MDYQNFKQLEFRRKFLKLLGAEITVSDPRTEQLVAKIQMKAWKMREDIRLYNASQQEVLRIHARQIIDFGATYDVFEGAGEQPLFSLRRKGLKSTFVRDHWLVLDPSENVVGDIQETSSGLALARRWLELLPFGDLIGLVFSFVAQTYTITVNDASGTPHTAGTIVHRKNPFIVKMGLDMTMDADASDHRIAVAGTALLSIVDASKNS